MTLGSQQTAAEDVADGTQEAANINYKGVPGTVFCNGGDCAVEEVMDDEGEAITDMRKLVGSWYFTPTSPMEYYVADADNEGSYTAETLFASYGHWLVPNDADNEWTVNTFAMSGGGTDVNLAEGTETDMLTDSAEYSGEAAGMSVYKSDDNIDSGRFTADVTLAAKFGDAPTVSGTIDNFQGSAVGSWSVALESATLAASGDNNGIAVTDGRNGTWSATAYGDDDTARPAGIFGGFVAHFSDGHAAGAYATQED